MDSIKLQNVTKILTNETKTESYGDKIKTKKVKIICTNCDKTFKDSSDLKKHVNKDVIHYGEFFDIQWLNCCKVFKCMGEWMEHRNQQHEGYYCTECEQDMMNIYSLRKHIESKHEN